MNKKAIVLMADGFEDVEAVTPIDYLRRAGVNVTTASISDNLTVTSRWGGIKLISDITLTDLLKQNRCDWDAVIVPGGMPGASNLAASNETSELLKKMAAAGKLICAICASPVVVLAPLGLISGKRFTCYPGLEMKAADSKSSDNLRSNEPQSDDKQPVELWSDDLWSDENVVVDGNIITSRAAGTAGKFAIVIIEQLLGRAAGKKIADSVLLENL